jgi:hypothetical protein
MNLSMQVLICYDTLETKQTGFFLVNDALLGPGSACFLPRNPTEYETIGMAAVWVQRSW